MGGHTWQKKAAAGVVTVLIAGAFGAGAAAATPAAAATGDVPVAVGDQARYIGGVRWVVAGPSTARATWDPVAGAAFYDVRIMRDGRQVEAQKVQGTSFDYTVTVPGSYTFAVAVAQSSGGPSSAVTQGRDTLVTVSLDPNNGEATVPVASLIDVGQRLRTQPTAPTWGSNTFEGWTTAPGDGALVPSYDFMWGPSVVAPMTLTAQWKLAAPAQVRWNTDRGIEVTWSAADGASGYRVQVTDAAGATVAEATVPAGAQTFSMDAPDASGAYEASVTALGGRAVAPSDPATTAAALCSVDFDAAGGSPAPAREFVVAGQAVARPADPTQDGLAFGGWFASGASVPYDFATPVTAPTTLTAHWSPMPCSVRLELDGGTLAGPDVTSYTPGTAVALPSATRVGCTFGGWYETDDFSGEAVDRIDATDTGDKVFYARWIPDTYLVYLDPEGGTILERRITHYTYGTGLTLPQKVTRPGHTFEGWYATPDFSGNPVEEIAPDATGNKAFYARWRANDYAITYEVDGGTLPEGASDGYVYGEGCALPVPTREGHTFEGWYEEPDFSGDPVTEVAPDAVGDKTFYARWSENPADESGDGSAGGSVDRPGDNPGDGSVDGSEGSLGNGSADGSVGRPGAGSADEGSGSGSGSDEGSFGGSGAGAAAGDSTAESGTAAVGDRATSDSDRATVVPAEGRDAAVALVAETGDFGQGGGALLAVAAAVVTAVLAWIRFKAPGRTSDR